MNLEEKWSVCVCEQFQVVSLSECSTQKVLDDVITIRVFHHFKPTSTRRRQQEDPGDIWEAMSKPWVLYFVLSSSFVILHTRYEAYQIKQSKPKKKIYDYILIWKRPTLCSIACGGKPGELIILRHHISSTFLLPLKWSLSKDLTQPRPTTVELIANVSSLPCSLGIFVHVL